MLEKFRSSFAALAGTRGLALTGMLIALHTVLGILKIPFALDNRITLTFAATAEAGFLLGPIPAILVGGFGDVLGFLINPGGSYFFGFTVSGMLGGLVYGMCLYRREKKGRIWWVMLAVFIITFFVNIILNTFWLSIMYKKAYQVFALQRIIKNFVMYPVHVIVIFELICITEKFVIRKTV